MVVVVWDLVLLALCIILALVLKNRAPKYGRAFTLASLLVVAITIFSIFHNHVL